MKTKKYISIVALSLVFATSCTKYETYPVERITSDIIYDKFDKNGTYAEWVVNDIYSYMPTGFNRLNGVMLDAATDDAIATRKNPAIERLSKSQLDANNNIDNNWDNAYAVVRKVNIFLANIDVVPRDEATKTYWKAEVRFLRALHYFELAKRFGGVPLLGDKYYKLEDKIEVSRSTFDEVISYVVAECDAIKDLLRTDPIQDVFLGRVTNGAALSLKARALLYAASPLHNPDNSTAKWQAAADASQALINSGKFSLVANFNDVFLTRKNNEIILARQEGQNANLERQNAPIGYTDPNTSNGVISPSQNFVDAFPMQNGLDITDPASGYNPQSPYLNRDPRLALNVFYNGMNWLNRPVELFMGGLDRPNSGFAATRQTRTGYYLKKFLSNFATSANYSNVNHNFPIFRYAEVLLNFAEAKNELNDQATAYAQLIALRKRSGIQAGSNNLYGLKPNMNKDQMRKAIQLERRLELAFEEHRFWDLRRWKLAEKELNKNIQGMEILKNQDGSLQYKTVPVDYVSFSPREYLYPIPQHEINANEGRLTQNPGWE